MNKLYTYYFLILFLACGCFYTQAQDRPNKQLDSLYLALSIQQNDTNKIITVKRLANLLIIKAETNQQCIDLVEMYLPLAEELNYTYGLAHLNFLLGYSYHGVEKFDEAIMYYETATEYFKELNDGDYLAKIDNNLGLAYQNLGKYPESVARYLKNAKYFEEKNDPLNASFGYSNLSTLYLEINEFGKALEYSLKSYKVAKELGGDFDVYYTAMFAGEVYEKIEDYDEALLYYNEAQQLAEEMDDQPLIGEISEKIGRLFITIDLDNAIGYLEKALSIAQNANLASSEVSVLNAIGLAHLKQGKLSEASKALNLSFSKIDRNSNKVAIIENYDLHASLLARQNNYKRALEWYYKKDSLESRTFRKGEINSIQTKYDLSLTEEAYNIAIESQDKILERQSKIIMYLIIFGVLAIILIIVIFYVYRIRSKYNTLINQQSLALQTSNDVKDKLFSIVSHDLRNSVISFDEIFKLLNEGSLSYEELKELLPRLSENASNTTLLLNNLLNWSSSQMNVLEARPKDFNINQLAKNKVHFYQFLAVEKNINLQNEMIDMNVYADEDMIGIVLQNLIGNAIKFCKKQDTICLQLMMNEFDEVILAVKDTGAGMSAEAVNNLFSDQALSTLGTKNEKGTGLGLMICKDLVEANNGKIWVESVENEGSTFYFSLPQSPS
jgi:signal transduction histidine kinase